MAMSIPEPFNPYTLPTERTAVSWLRWAAQAFVLTIVATLIWDRGTSIRPEVKGQVQPLAAPAQWVSALLLPTGSFCAALAIAMPWGAIPLAFGFAVMTRRVLAAEGAELTVEAATHKLAGKVVLAGLGIGAWWGSIFLSGWVQSFASTLMSNPLTKMAAGASAAEELEKQTAGMVEAIQSAGILVGFALVFISVLLWSRSAHQAAMGATAEQRRDAEKAATAEEATNV